MRDEEEGGGQRKVTACQVSWHFLHVIKSYTWVRISRMVLTSNSLSFHLSEKPWSGTESTLSCGATRSSHPLVHARH